MTRDKFIRKWLANPQKQYNEQCRDEMRDDLDLLIKGAIGKLEQKQLITEIMSEDAKDGLYKKQTAVEWFAEQIIRKHPIITQYLPNYNFDKELIEQAKEMEKQQKNNLPIFIHQGIENTWVYIEDGIVHIKPNPKANEQQ